jgi:hypothetical protein
MNLPTLTSYNTHIKYTTVLEFEHLMRQKNRH